MFSCHICTTKIDTKNSIWFPERASNKNYVYPICFKCCDNICIAFSKPKGLLNYVHKRQIYGYMDYNKYNKC